MRKSSSIVLLLCFVIFNYGYYGFYFSAKHSLEKDWRDKIFGENEIALEEHVLALPFNAPYMPNQDEFQPTNTRFEKDGKYFRAIKQRYSNDTLEVIYVRDIARKRLDNSFEKWVVAFGDDESQRDQNNQLLIKLVSKDYLESSIYQLESSVGLVQPIHFGDWVFDYSSPYFVLDSPPPQIS